MERAKETDPGEIRGEPRHRRLSGPLGAFQSLLLVSLPGLGVLFIANVPSELGLVVYREQFVALFLGITLVSVFLGIPAGKNAPRDRIPWYDLAAIPFCLIASLYVALFYPELVYQLGYITPARVVLGSLLIVLVLEGIRRTVGWPLVILVAAFLLYGRSSDLFPGPLRGKAITWARLVNYLYLDTNSYLDIVGIAATVVLGFIVFGHILYNFGGGTFIINLAFALLGRYRGGPAKVSIVSSSLFGTISGSAVANVIVDGVVTIPMMKKAGLRPHQAAAVEAVTSTGGQIMPPVMGVAAFLIAEFLEIPYAEVAVAAFIPALFYYFALFVQLDLEAAKDGRLGSPAHTLPRLARVLRDGWYFVLALLCLIYTLMILALPPGTAGVASGLFTLGLILLQKDGRRDFPRRLYATLEDSGRTLLDICIVLTAAGFIMGVMGASGLGFNLSFALIQVAKGNVAWLLVLSAVVCLILGMGLPTTAAYVLVAVLVAPALTQMGIPPLAAHLFIFYYAILSVITPPVALATFAAAAIARAEPMRAGFEAMRLAFVAYLIPFLFVFTPALIAKGSLAQILLEVGAAAIGVWVLSVSLVGFLFTRLSWAKRVLMALAGMAILAPWVPTPYALIPDLAGAAVGIALVLWEWQRGTRGQEPLTAAPEHEIPILDPERSAK